MSKVTQKIENNLKEWREQGIPLWKKDQLIRDCLIRFKDNQWELTATAEELTERDKPQFDEAFALKFPMHQAEVDKYNQSFEAGRAFSSVKNLAFESPEQVQEYLDIIGETLPDVYRTVNKILGVVAFTVAPATESGASEKAEDLGLDK